MFIWKWVGTTEQAGPFCWDSFYSVLYEVFHLCQPGQAACLHHVTFLMLVRSLWFTIWHPWIWGLYLLVWLIWLLSWHYFWNFTDSCNSKIENDKKKKHEQEKRKLLFDFRNYRSVVEKLISRLSPKSFLRKKVLG